MQRNLLLCVFLSLCAQSQTVHLRHAQSSTVSDLAEPYIGRGDVAALEPRKAPEFFAFHNMVPGTDAINHFWDNNLQSHTFHAGAPVGVEIELSTDFYAFGHPVPNAVPIYQVSNDGAKQQVQFYAFATLDAAQRYAAAQGLGADHAMLLASNKTEGEVQISPLDATTDAEVQQVWDESVQHDRADLSPPQLQNASDGDWYSDYFAFRQNNGLEQLSYTANQTQPTAEQAQAVQQREDDAWANLEPNVTAEEEEAYRYYHDNFSHDAGNALENFTISDAYYEVNDAAVQLGRSASQMDADTQANASSAANASEANNTSDEA
mmetsp:Transcript_9344/g.16902  ORF Transcript_9344/g.16902 Transcript_9344/m.16902 type:complete len:321 (-) Transcript_9344:30-992(-)